MEFPLALAFDDVLLKPQYSDIESRSTVSLKTRLSKNVTLNVPLISSNMDTVTEENMAISMAKCGGIGIIHRYCSIEDQVQMVKKVKRSESFIISEPYTLLESDTITFLKQKSKELRVNSFLIVDLNKKLLGIITTRDLYLAQDNDLVKKYMTVIDQVRGIVHKGVISREEAKEIMCTNKIQKLPIIDRLFTLKGLICLKDINRIEKYPLANTDKKGRLVCGAAVGVKDNDMERVKELVKAQVDVIVIDVAHGFSKMCIEMIKKIKSIYSIDVIAGNVASEEGAEALIKAGADGIKCGVGSGAICSTRLVSGHGIPQLTAVLDSAKACKKYNVPLISDGGNRNYGNISKALAAGASSVMLGRMVAGADESPGKIMIKDGKRVKIYRGMASYGANLANAQRQNFKEPDSITSHIEGVEGYVPCTGPVQDTINQICNGIRSGMSYSGAHDIKELQEKAQFVRITGNGVIESGIHDIII